MKSQKQQSFPLAAMAAALLAAYGPVHAQEATIAELTTPVSSVSVGAGYLSKDAPRFGMYSGVREEGMYGLLGVDVNKLDRDTGTWFKLKGNNLGLESRDMRLQHERQGDWGYVIDYTEMPRFEPYTANTAVTGIGTPSLVIPSSAAAVEVPVDLKTKREALGLGFTKVLGRGFDLQVRLRNEEKDGSRIFARGTNASPSAWEFAPEPIHSTTRQLDAILGYTGKKLQVSASYYGTSYNNDNTALLIAGGNAALSTFSPIALPPDSQSHQLAVGGGYDFSTTTRGTFKMAYTRATQEDTFIGGVPLAAGISPTGNLGGRVDTTLLQLGVTSRPISKLSLVADVRQEERDNKTPVRKYTTAGVAGGSTFNGDNEPYSIRSTNGKMEASYRLPLAMRVTGGIDYVEKERNTSAVRAVSFRERTEEISYRMGLQRSMSETVSGSITYIHSDRDGSNFLTTVLNNGTPGLNLIAPLNLADRKRDKLRLSASWTPVEQLSLQFQTEQTRDDYSQRTPEEFGLRDGSSKTHAIDLSYAFSDEWTATAWISSNETVANAADRISTTQYWASKVINDATSFGFGVRGKPFSKLEIGADLSHSEIDDIFQQWATRGAAIGTVPGFYTRQSSLKLFGTYALQKNSSIRLDYVYDRYASNDWTWSRWMYSDGTTLSQRPRQNVNFVGVTYIYRFY